jgi:hypothetical protein
MRNPFWTLLKESVLVTGIIALAFTLTVCYLSIIGREVPPVLVNFTGIALAFFFGVKVQNAIK